MYTIKNEYLTLQVSLDAAQMHSLKRNNDNYEFIWNGDPTYWKGRNPILFPQVSSTSTKTNIINGKQYPMGNHGFARNSVFELVDIKEDSLTLLLRENEETLKQYPFKFELYVTYTLNNELLEITYKIKNTDTQVLPFGFGLHPAFNVEKDYKDTKITFDNGQELVVNKELFEKFPTYYVEPTPSSATLLSNNHSVTLNFEGFRHLAIWSPFAPFVCVEPWMNLGPNDSDEFQERAEYAHLDSNQSIEYKYSILAK